MITRALNTKNMQFYVHVTHAALWAYLFVFLYELGCFHPTAHVEADVYLDFGQGVRQFNDGDLGGQERWKIRGHANTFTGKSNENKNTQSPRRDS